MSKYQIVSGVHSVRAALRHGSEGVAEVLVERRRQDRKIKEIMELAKSQGVPIQLVSRDELERLAPDINHQGVAARARVPISIPEKELPALLQGKQPLFILVLDGVQDPHNLGACLRSADAAGVDLVLAPKDRSAGLTPVACKVASGAAESVPFVQVTNLARTLKWLKEECGVWLIGTAGEAENDIYSTDLKGNIALLMGGEEKGLRRLTREQCDMLVKLPMAGAVESLNVSVASGICLFEAVRQRSAS